MEKVIVFAGTTEGYELCRFLSEHQISVYACAATEYGGKALTETPYLHIHTGRLSREEMEAFFLKEAPNFVLDATHPYAAEVTDNIKSACEKTGFFYQRVLREQGRQAEKAVYVESTEAAAEFLNTTEGNVLLTTGSKELKKFLGVKDYKERLYARVLSLPSVMEECSAAGFEGKHLIGMQGPFSRELNEAMLRRLYARVLSLPSVMEECSAAGFEGKHLIGMQGPFSRELNEAMLRQFHCRYLVTKDSGKAGGFQEKIDAAFSCGAIPVIIGRPLKEEGLSLVECKKRYLVTKDSGKAGGFQEKIDAAFSCGAIPVIIGRPLKEEGLSLVECKKWLSQNLGFSLKPQITLLGIGMGSRDTLTIEGEKALEKAELLIGARRIADSVKMPHHTVIYEYDSEKILKCIEENSQYEHIVIALSGDVGFYSGAKKLLHNLGEDTRVICGISSVVYFMAKAGLSWDDAKIVSAHGRNCNLVSLICHSKKVFSILGTKDGISSLAGRLVSYGMGDVLLYVGENLSYENEKIFVKPAKELVSYEGDALCVVCAYNENASELMSTHGIKDECFIRGKAPMTKEEVRTVSLMKLGLSEDSVCYDVGAGTGSVAHGIKDECFIRGKAPMTKEEVRTVSLMKLGLSEDSVCYDVGAGTGSVAVEMALRAHQGKVYAIEKKEDALALILENKKKFAADNLEIVGGCAPEAMEELPVPTHAFIGGSSGNLKDIIRLLLNKNPEVKIVINCITLETVGEAMEAIREFDFQERDISGNLKDIIRLLLNKNPEVKIVINCITLETVGEAMEAIREFDFQERDIVQMSVSRSKEVGRYHMMMGENPIYIFTCRRASL